MRVAQALIPHPQHEAPAELIVDCRCVLGESILWHRGQELLLWTDIQSSRLWMHSPSGKQTHYWSLPDRLGCLAFCESGKLLFGLAKGLYLAELDFYSTDAPRLTPLAPVEAEEPRTRINDGRCDRAGNFVFGTLSEDATRARIGSFYQYSAQHGLRRLDLGPVAVPNSLCFSPDGGTLYYCDSHLPRILCCDYQADAARVCNWRTFAELDGEHGSADGSTVDAAGYLWNAQWGASRIVRYTPQGAIDRVVTVPAKHPSCVTFGGAHLDQLYITTARLDLTSGELEHLPESGGVYGWMAANLRGLPENEVRFL